MWYIELCIQYIVKLEEMRIWRMDIIKRDGTKEEYCAAKIRNAVNAAFASVEEQVDDRTLDGITSQVESKIRQMCGDGIAVYVEDIQDMVEKTLMERNYYPVMKSYILYREERAQKRRTRHQLAEYLQGLPGIQDALRDIQRDYPDEGYGLAHLQAKFLAFYKPGMGQKESVDALLRAAVELTTQEAPDWEFIAARFRMLLFQEQVGTECGNRGIHNFYEKLVYLTENNLYGPYILQTYSREEIEEFAEFMEPARDHLFTYSALELLLKRYVIKDRSNIPLETPQEMFLGIAMHLAIPEKQGRRDWVLRFYELLSRLQVTMATPTLSNAR